MDSDFQYLFKIILIGDSGVGKTCLIKRYTDNVYLGNYISTIGVDFKIKTLKIGEETVKLQIWDTAGQERFRTITNSYYRGAHGIILVFDATDAESFPVVTDWMKEIRENAPKEVEILLVGNKYDLKDEIAVKESDIETFRNNFNIKEESVMKVSAKDDMNVNELFIKLADTLVKKEKKYGPIIKKDKESFNFKNLEDPENRRGFGCC